MTRPKDPLFDERIAEWFAGDADKAPGEALEMVLAAFPSVTQQRVIHRMPWNLPRLSMPTRLAAAVVIGVLAVGSAVYVTRPGQPAIGAPATTSDPSASTSQPAVVVPSATPTALPTLTATPSPTPAPIIWTQASLKEDWPAPVRTEPAGGASVEPLLLRLTGDRDECGRTADPVGDTGSDAYPWVEIREFVFCGTTVLGFTLDSNQPPVVHPTEQWIAYGVVTDDDGDGVADRRIGMDNVPHAADQLDYRAWTTDLHTGRTIVGWTSDGFSDSWYPPGSGRLPRTDVDFRFGGGDLTGGGSQPETIPERFYFWASVIQGGQVVATDYAPDVGWLTRPSTPTSTPQVETTPRPGPTPQVKDDPDVPGGRLWTTTVVNNSPKPATFFVAEDDGSDAMGPLVGAVTPSVVPPNTTMKLTFALPPEGSRGWYIWVNPGRPNQIGLSWDDVPAYGEFRIQADGSSGWRSLIP